MLVANSCWYLFNFRLPLLCDLRARGYKVSIVAPTDAYTSDLTSSGFHVHEWSLSRSSVNPILELRALLDLYRIYRSEKPSLVHHFTIKACLYGTLAAKFARVYRVINAVTGLGHVFLGKRKRSLVMQKFIKPIYQLAFTARRSTVIFQNAADLEKLIQLGITSNDKSELIRGSGVDINYFDPEAVSNFSVPGEFHTPFRVLFPSRIIKEKGILELLTAMKMLWADNIECRLLIAGLVDTGNRSSIDSDDLACLNSHPCISLLGHVEDMRQLYATSDVVVLPSWREGLSRALTEAAAMQRPIVTTDVPGCRDVVDHARSGLLVPINSPVSIYLALRLLIENSHLAFKLGTLARKKVLREFQLPLVNEATLATYNRLLPVTPLNLVSTLPSSADILPNKNYAA